MGNKPTYKKENGALGRILAGGTFRFARTVNGNWGLLPKTKNRMNARCVINR